MKCLVFIGLALFLGHSFIALADATDDRLTNLEVKVANLENEQAPATSAQLYYSCDSDQATLSITEVTSPQGEVVSTSMTPDPYVNSSCLSLKSLYETSRATITQNTQIYLCRWLSTNSYRLDIYIATLFPRLELVEANQSAYADFASCLAAVKQMSLKP